MRQHGSIIPGLILILIGVFLLLEGTHVYLFKWDLLIPGAAFILGLIMWSNCLRSQTRCKAFSGTLFVVLGGFFFLWNYGTFISRMYDFWPIFPTAFGLAFLSMFLANWRHWWALFLAAPLLIVGVPNMMYHLRIIDFITVEDIFYRTEDLLYSIGDHYPWLIILIGLIIILLSIRKTKMRHKTDHP